MSSKTRNQIYLVLTLLPVLGFLIWNNLIIPSLKNKHMAQRMSQSTALPSVQKVLKPATNDSVAPQDIEAYRALDWDKNPFDQPNLEPVVKKPPKPKALPRFHLEGVVADTGSPYAIIDGEVRQVGDVVKAFTVISITGRGVTLKNGDDVIELNLFQDSF